ncbi:alpha/beta hydrolase [Candidatus Dojkabacteria bacterium]|nr:alpha/beta hydrolase [Candidatus Dojkabacteria bacterium]
MKSKLKIIILLIFATLSILLLLPYIIPLKRMETCTKEDLVSDNGTFLLVEGKQIYIEDFGSKSSEKVLVFIHGFGSNNYSWRKNIPFFTEKGYRAIAIELLGFGLSDKDWKSDYSHPAQADRIKSILDQLELNNVTLVGHSMGGNVAVHFTHKYPEYVDKLILVDGSVFTKSINGHPNLPLSFFLELPPIRRTARHILRFFLTEERSKQIFQSTFYNKDYLTNEILEGYGERTIIGEWDLSLLAATRDYNRNMIKFELQEIKTTTLVITGDNDTWVSPDLAERISREIEPSELIIISNAGHLPMEEQSEIFNQELYAFLTTDYE